MQADQTLSLQLDWLLLMFIARADVSLHAATERATQARSKSREASKRVNCLPSPPVRTQCASALSACCGSCWTTRSGERRCVPNGRSLWFLGREALGACAFGSS
jgi:hypothetical protein